MKHHKWMVMAIVVSGLLPLFSMFLQAATGPSWWVTRGTVNTNAFPNDFAAINQGQLKWMATNAAAELEAQLPGGAGSGVWALVTSFSNTNNYRPVNLGQLKYVSQPFYDRLIAVGYATNYPWNNSTNAPRDFALANIGQAKYVFSFDVAPWLVLDSDGDAMTNSWEVANGLNTRVNDANVDADGDGFTNWEEYLAGTNPQASNSHPSALLTIPNSWALYTATNQVEVTADIRSTNAWVKVKAAEYFLDSTNGVVNGTGNAMSATNGAFNSTNIIAKATFTPSFPYGERHEIFVHAQGQDNQWCPFVKVILNPNVNDILDKVKANYSKIANISYTMTSKAFIGDSIVRTETVLFRQKGPYKMRWDNQTTGVVTIIKENEIGVIDANGQLTPMFVVMGDDPSGESSKSTPFYWDTDRFKAQHDLGSVTAITNSPGVCRFSATMKEGIALPYGTMNAEVDFRYGAVTRIEYLNESQPAFSVEQPSAQEIAAGVWFHSQENGTAPITTNWSLRHNREIQMPTIQINSGNMLDSLFDF